MNKIYILEHFDFSPEQFEEINALGKVKYFEKANQQEIDDAIQNADAILLDWLDPDPILAKIGGGNSFVCHTRVMIG